MLVYFLALIALVLIYYLYSSLQETKPPKPSSAEPTVPRDIVHHILEQISNAKSEDEKNNLNEQLKIILETLVATTPEMAELKLSLET